MLGLILYIYVAEYYPPYYRTCVLWFKQVFPYFNDIASIRLDKSVTVDFTGKSRVMAGIKVVFDRVSDSNRSWCLAQFEKLTHIRS